MKCIRTEHRVVEVEREISAKPKYKIGDYLEVYCGHLEGHEFVVKDVRYNLDRQCFEYKYNWPLEAEWYSEQVLTKNSYAR
jgi:hypothetical protein